MGTGWKGKRVVVLGLARQGSALARYLAEEGASVVVSDLKSAASLTNERRSLSDLRIEFVLGAHPAELIDGIDALFLSGGVSADVPLAQAARLRSIPLSNDAQLFLEACVARTIGITGSAGKSTTTALTGRMLSAELERSGRRAWVGGNIGNPLIGELLRIHKDDLAVIELSSFQLELMTRSPNLAAILNITPNHLDRHRTMEAYTAAKARILDYQTEQDIAVLGRDDPGAWALRGRVTGRLLSFGASPDFEGDGTYLQTGAIWLRQAGVDRELVTTRAMHLKGAHNLLNAAAASAIAVAFGVSPQAMQSGLDGFYGLPHRLEFVRKVMGADWYNDSIATAPERTLAALSVFEAPLVLLLGGRDKDLPWEPLLEQVKARVDHLVLFGEIGSLIAKSLGKRIGHQRPYSVQVCANLAEAVAAAAQASGEGDVVLLSPGATSFDEFADFAERGERFKQMVMGL